MVENAYERAARLRTLLQSSAIYYSAFIEESPHERADIRRALQTSAIKCLLRCDCETGN